MFFLIANVIPHTRQLRFADGKSSVSILPFEFGVDILSRPFRNARFQILQKFRYILVGSKTNDNMNMVGNTADLNTNTAQCPDRSAYVFIEPPSVLSDNERKTSLGCEYYVKKYMFEALWLSSFTKACAILIYIGQTARLASGRHVAHSQRLSGQRFQIQTLAFLF